MKLHSGNSIRAIGLMSGTSLDGLDIAAAEFHFSRNKWKYKLINAKTVRYSNEWKEKLIYAASYSGEQLFQLHSDYGTYTGKKIKSFIRKTGFQPQLIASHGHTVFHQPGNGFTFQVGSGAVIAALTGITTVADFRSGDVALEGQGAPLVPVGDKLLFGDYDCCLNLGGFANISFDLMDKRMAFDICPVNIVLNKLAEKQGYNYDKDGLLGKKGNLNLPLLENLNMLPYYKTKPPKSLGREWIEDIFMSELNKYNIPDNNKLRTCYRHITKQLSNSIPRNSRVFVTGGGAFNQYLISELKKITMAELIIPDKNTVKFKEAIVFAFLGVLRQRNEINCLASVTGAARDSSAGVVYEI